MCSRAEDPGPISLLSYPQKAWRKEAIVTIHDGKPWVHLKLLVKWTVCEKAHGWKGGVTHPHQSSLDQVSQ